MTRKDYVALAAALLHARPANSGVQRDQWEKDVLTVADVLGRDNARFDRMRFVNAAGIED